MTLKYNIFKCMASGLGSTLRGILMGFQPFENIKVVIFRVIIYGAETFVSPFKTYVVAKTFFIAFFIKYTAAPYWIASRSPVCPITAPLPTPCPLRDLYDTTKHINPEDGNCNIFRNVARPSAFDAVWSQNPKSCI
jgi:hypothetical protein